MAFAYHSLRTIFDIGTPDGTAGSRRCLHGYITNDTALSVMIDNYFLPAWSHFKVGDIIHCAVDAAGSPKVIQLIVTAASKLGVKVDRQTPAKSTGRPYNNRWAYFGHSKTKMNAVANVFGQLTRALSHGWLTWARILSGGRITTTAADNGGYDGDTIVPATRGGVTYPGMTSRIDAFLAQTDAAVIVLQLHTNRTTSISTATGLEISVAESMVGQDYIVNRCLADGRMVVLLTDDPRGDSTNTGNRLSTVDTRRAAYLNRNILNQAGKPGILVLNTWDLCANYTSGFGDIQSLLTYDGLHQVQVLAYRIGAALAEIARNLYPRRRDYMPMANTDAYDVTDNPKGNLLTQSFFGGTTGVLASVGASAAVQVSPSGTNAAGIATNWTEKIYPVWTATTAYSVGQQRTNGANIYECTTAGTSASSGGPTGTGTGIADGTVVWKYVATGLTAIYSKVTGASAFNGVNYEGNILKDWQQVNLGGTPTAAMEVDILQQTLPSGNLSINDILTNAGIEVEVDSMSGLAGFGLRLYSYGISTLFAADLGGTTETNSFQMPNVAWTGPLKCLDTLITTTSMSFGIFVRTIANQAVSSVVRVRGAAVDKL